MIYVAFSGAGTALLPGGASVHIHRLLHDKPEAERAGITLVTGGCIGVDALVAEIGYRAGYPVHTVLPARRVFVDRRWREWCSSYEELPEGTDYRDRNIRLLELSQFLIAYPMYLEHDRRSHRSGTWQTLRLARNMGMPSQIYVIEHLSRGL